MWVTQSFMTLNTVSEFGRKWQEKKWCLVYSCSGSLRASQESAIGSAWLVTDAL